MKSKQNYSKVFTNEVYEDDIKLVKKEHNEMRKSQALFGILKINNTVNIVAKIGKTYKNIPAQLIENEYLYDFISKEKIDFYTTKFAEANLKGNEKNISDAKLIIDHKGFYFNDMLVLDEFIEFLNVIFNNSTQWSIAEYYKKIEGLKRVVTYNKKIEKESAKKFLKLKKIKGVKVLSRENSESENGYTIKYRLENQRTVVFEYNVNGTLKATTICSNKKTAIHNIVYFEKEIRDFVEELTEVIKDKKVTIKTILKYFIFIAIIVGIMALVFLYVYKDSNGTPNFSRTYSIAINIFSLNNVFIWLSVWVWTICSQFLMGWMKYRMFKKQGIKVKIRHLVISNIMGSVIAFVTPFAIGGDAVGYWYLRKHGVKKGALIATLSSSTLIGEAKFLLQTAVLVGIGWPIYTHIFGSSDPEAHAALIAFFLGMSWSVFATSMIFILTLSRKVQEFILFKAIKILSWFKYTYIHDEYTVMSGYQYQFKELRKGMKNIWLDRKFALELFIYEMIFMLVSPGNLIYEMSGIINPNIGVNGYMAQLVAGDIVGTANSMSLTPGGSGTSEWLTVTIDKYIFTNSEFANKTGEDPSLIASASDFMWKILMGWPWLVVSTITIIIGIYTTNSHTKTKTYKVKKLTLITSLVSASLIAYSLLLYFIFY